MERSELHGDRTEDLSWARTASAITLRCFFCQRPGAIYDRTTRLGSARIPRCPTGQGCADGRIFHGPPVFTAHWPGEDCTICAGRRTTGRRIAGNTGPRRGRSSNQSSWHR
jgi:hypothetical protein